MIFFFFWKLFWKIFSEGFFWKIFKNEDLVFIIWKGQILRPFQAPQNWNLKTKVKLRVGYVYIQRPPPWSVGRENRKLNGMEYEFSGLSLSCGTYCISLTIHSEGESEREMYPDQWEPRILKIWSLRDHATLSYDGFSGFFF